MTSAHSNGATPWLGSSTMARAALTVTLARPGRRNTHCAEPPTIATTPSGVPSGSPVKKCAFTIGSVGAPGFKPRALGARRLRRQALRRSPRSPSRPGLARREPAERPDTRLPAMASDLIRVPNSTAPPLGRDELYSPGVDEGLAQRLTGDQRARAFLLAARARVLTNTRQKPCAEAWSIGVLSADTASGSHRTR